MGSAVERYHNVTENPNLLLNFMDLGCLLQVNSSSIIGLAGKKAMKTAMELIFRNMVSIVASDCHSNKGRSPKLSQAFHIISSCVDIQKAEQLFTTNPLKVVNNQDVTIDGEMIHNRRFRKFLSC